jgi:hypothetical protein
VPARTFRFLSIAPSVLEESVFLDTRIQAQLAQATPVAADRLDGVGPAASTGFLFHTSFCCSTLLARLLHVEGRSIALKEPLVLRRLADARHSGVPAGKLTGLSVRLLARPWTNGGHVLIKPTHVALNIATELLEAAPAARAVLLYGTLEDFLISNIKKPPASQQKVPELAERALLASGWHERLPREALAPPDFLSGVALQWCAQLELAGCCCRARPAGAYAFCGSAICLPTSPGPHGARRAGSISTFPTRRWRRASRQPPAATPSSPMPSTAPSGAPPSRPC